MNRLIFIAILASTILHAQEWKVESKTDAFTGKSYVLATLQGKFLQPPNGHSNLTPEIILKCEPGIHKYGLGHHTNGKMLKGYIYFGAVLDDNTTVEPHPGGHLKYRLDNGKIHETPIDYSTDYSSAFFDSTDLNTFLYGHFMEHKEGTTPPVKNLLLSIDQFLGGSIVAEFAMPDPAPIQDVCGVVTHKN